MFILKKRIELLSTIKLIFSQRFNENRCNKNK